MSTVIDRIVNTAKDLTVLNVATLTGDVNVTLDGAGNFDFNHIVDSLRTEAAKTDGTVKLVALTHIEMDQDVVHFEKADLTDAERLLVTSHGDLVDTSKNARMDFLDFVKRVVD